MTVGDFLQETEQKFTSAGITSARLDAQVLAAHFLERDKAWLLAHGDEHIQTNVFARLQVAVARREQREPIAYLVGHQEFYGRQFFVTPEVLIPRPETEALVSQLTGLNLPPGATVLDVGTGSGAIAVTAALEKPQLHVQACDISKPALAVAKKNARTLGANVHFFISNLLEQTARYDCIVANLPYVSPEWKVSPETAA